MSENFNSSNKPFSAKITPFIGFGIFIVLLIVGIILLSYLFIFGAIIGLVLYITAWIKMKMGQKKRKTNFSDDIGSHTNAVNSHKGNVYEHEKE